MKLFKLIPACIIAIFAFSTNAAVAEDCSWGAYQIRTVSGGLDISYLCKVGTSTKATKKVYSPIKGSPTCSISTAAQFRNAGTCISPNIVKIPAVCPVIDIGMSCNGQNYCAEAFGRTCYNRGGVTKYENGQAVCREKCN